MENNKKLFRVTVDVFVLPNNKILQPCFYGVRCSSGSKCKYWHSEKMLPVPLCPNAKCTDKKCTKSHDLSQSLNLDQGPYLYQGQYLDQGQYTSREICNYGIKCRKINECGKIHPLDGNLNLIGKSNLLYRVGQLSANIPIQYFDIKVYDSKMIGHLDKYKPTRTRDLLDSFICNAKYKRMKHNIEISITIREYEFLHYQCYQSFANDCIGGGVLRKGYVQEEKLVLTLSLLQYLMYGFQYNKNSCLSNKLSTDPIVIDTNVIIKDHSYHKYDEPSISIHYATKGLIEVSDMDKASRLYTAIENPIPIRIVCVAMPDIVKNKETYNIDNLYKAFGSLFISNLTLLRVVETDSQYDSTTYHIGNIGCGAFGHNYNTVYLLQMLAMNCAIDCINPKKKVILIYHAFSETTRKSINIYAECVLNTWIYKSLSYEDCLRDLYCKQMSHPEIWKNKL